MPYFSRALKLLCYDVSTWGIYMSYLSVIVVGMGGRGGGEILWFIES